MLISHKYRIIFIHIQRTGGTSMINAFVEADPHIIQEVAVEPHKKRIKHCFISDIQPRVAPEIFADYTKFTVVRNPYERLLSWYLMFKHDTMGDMSTVIGKPVTEEEIPAFLGKPTAHGLVWFNKIKASMKPYMNSFDDFLTMPNEGWYQRFYYNQLDYLQINEHLAVDKILRFENLSDDFNHFSKQLNFNNRLSHINKSVSNNYRKAYNETSRKIVAQRFKKDLDFFGYDF